MPSATARPSPSQLLHHLPLHRVLICKECRYAIQPSAISRHLKDLHRIYRSDRQELIEYAKELHLADPGEVILPPPDEAPVPLLPTESGLACVADGCAHLCVTVKRMKSHWSTAHRDAVGDGGAQWRPVTLQTFFRGNQLRYFVVSGESSPEPKEEQSSETDSTKQSPETDSDAPSLVSEISLPPDFSDLALFNHFMQSTYRDLGHGEASRKLWHVSIPELSNDHDFLRHGILACSALHLAHLQPDNRRRYQMSAACHQARALPQFRAAVANPTRENCNAILAFSQLLIVHCFASEQADEDLLLVKGKQDSGLPDWLQIVRSSCVMFSAVWSYMQAGILSSLIEEGIQEEEALSIIPENPTHAERLKKLLTLPLFGKSPLVSLATAETDVKLTWYSSALLSLCRAFVRATAAKERGAFTMWTAVNIWPARISMEYLDLLAAREPAALVLLAHYCVLLEPLEQAWYMSGFRKRLLSRIYWQLEEEWRVWLEWPFAEAGLKLEEMMEDVRMEVV